VQLASELTWAAGIEVESSLKQRPAEHTDVIHLLNTVRKINLLINQRDPGPKLRVELGTGCNVSFNRPSTRRYQALMPAFTR